MSQLRKHPIVTIYKHFPQKTDKTYWKTETHMAERTVLLPLYWISPLLPNLIFLLQRILQIYFFRYPLYPYCAVYVNHPFSNAEKKNLPTSMFPRLVCTLVYNFIGWNLKNILVRAFDWTDVYLMMLWIVYQGKQLENDFYFPHTKDSISFMFVVYVIMIVS